MKDHEIAQLVNKLTEIAVEYGQSQQLRERIRHELEPFLKNLEQVDQAHVLKFSNWANESPYAHPQPKPAVL